MFNKSSFLDSIPPVVKNLLAINIILWLATFVLPGMFRRWGLQVDLNDILGMHYWGSEKFNVAQLVTYSFMHANFNHVFFNMFAVYMFGSSLENLWGSRKFLFYYIVTGVGAAVVQQAFWTVEYQPLVNAMNDAIAANSGALLIPFEATLSNFFRLSNLSSFDAGSILEMKNMLLNLPITVGASGSVFGLLLAYGWLFPEARLMMLFFPVPIKARIFVLIYGVVELFLGVANFSGDNIAHFAHLGGMLFGIILILIWKKKNTLYR
ncbi:MAG: rhomboid family intramembrane serine protease [Porphyromonadaceae bacterium CG2_30_38_12]|nr:MAG: rhomboid family intramembrane serine protease [Porphyromonadaceae bacterium CG2_30_38_12]